MSLIRYNASDYVPVTFSSMIDRNFNDSMTRSGGSTCVPKVDILENEKSYELQVAAPGISKDDFKIELNDNVLTVSGERKFTNEKKDKNFQAFATML